MLVLLSLCVMLSILSIVVCAEASLFCACLVSVNVSAGVVHLSLQEDGKVTFEEIPVYVVQPAMILPCISGTGPFSGGCSLPQTYA